MMDNNRAPLNFIPYIILKYTMQMLIADSDVKFNMNILNEIGYATWNTIKLYYSLDILSKLILGSCICL